MVKYKGQVTAETEEIAENQKDRRHNKNASDLTLIIFRWLFLTAAAVLLAVDPHGQGSTTTLLETFAIILICQILSTHYSLKCFHAGKSMPTALFYLDIFILSVLCYFNGGLESDIYIILFFLIGYCGIFNKSSMTVKITFFCVFLYTAAAFLAVSDNVKSLNYWLLIIRDSFIIFGGFGVSRINAEIKKYDDLHKREFLLARTDRLTGLANRHYFDQKLREEVEYADSTGSPLNVLMFDLDNFKRFNDTYGHVWGDKLLTLFADIIRQNIRKTDIPVRFGGEEFLILIRDLDIVIAASVAERIRRQLEKQRIYVGDLIERKEVTVSGGVAQYPVHSPNIKAVIDMADKALYTAKETGKNKVVCYDELLDSKAVHGS